MNEIPEGASANLTTRLWTWYLALMAAVSLYLTIDYTCLVISGNQPVRRWAALVIWCMIFQASSSLLIRTIIRKSRPVYRMDQTNLN